MESGRGEVVVPANCMKVDLCRTIAVMIDFGVPLEHGQLVIPEENSDESFFLAFNEESNGCTCLSPPLSLDGALAPRSCEARAYRPAWG